MGPRTIGIRKKSLQRRGNGYTGVLKMNWNGSIKGELLS